MMITYPGVGEREDSTTAIKLRCNNVEKEKIFSVTV
jgi:hypothetical protein